VDDIADVINAALGLDAETLDVVQMALRTVITYFVALAFIRVGDKRFLGKNTAFDVVIGIMFGSVMSRAITSSGEFVPVLVAGGVLVALHFTVALITFRSDKVGTLVKGRERTLVRDGEIQWEEMATAHVTERDLRGALRAQGKTEDLGQVRLATLERSGDISVITREPD
jgi:uncharacterized membrane protein YcaP (DUF421 family)